MKKRKHLYVQIWIIGCTVLFMLLFTGGSHAEQRQFNWWGELGYDFLSHQFESAEDRLEHAGLLRLNGAGYLYEPWLAVVEGGVGMYLRRTDTDSGDSSADNLFGNGIVRMFSQSRFPLDLFAEKTDSRSDSDLTGLVIDRTRYGINQSYISEGGSTVNVGYEHSDTTNVTTTTASGERLREDVSDLFRAAFNTAFGAHSISFDSTVNKVDITNSVDFNESAFATLRHAYTPSPVFSSEDMLTYNSTNVTTDNSRFESDVTQLNSFGFWRPRTKRPLRVNGTIRAVTRQSETLANESEAQSANGTLGATYEWSPRWLFNANAGMSGSEAENQRVTTHFQALSALYTSPTYRPFEIDAGWFGQMDARNTNDDGNRVQEAGGQIGYNLDKSVTGENRHFYSMRFSQSINAITTTDDFNSASLFSSASASWNRRGTRSNGMARFSMSDNRTVASGPNSDQVDGEFQLINLQASVDNKISSTSSIRANATLQITRSYKPNIPGLIEGSNGDWIPTSTVDVSYYKVGLFQVPQLTFHSIFRHVSNSYAPLVGEPTGRTQRDDNQWENRLEYTVGRLSLRLVSRLSDTQGEKQNYFLFQARRLFGDL